MSHLGRLLRKTGMIAALISWFSSSAAADPICILLQRHIVGAAQASDETGFDSTERRFDTLETGLFDVQLAEQVRVPTLTASYSVAQKSDIAAGGWSGSGSAQAAADESPQGSFAVAEAEALMRIVFNLSSPMRYQFMGSTTGEFGSSISLAGPGLFWDVMGDSGMSTRSGLLSPGEYDFTARAFAISTCCGGSSFNLDFRLFEPTPVPEPATLILFGTGVAFVGRRAWSRRLEQSGAGSSDPIGVA